MSHAMTRKRHTKRHAKARKRNANGTVVLQITITQQLNKALEKITSTGLFGSNRAAAAERLLAEQLRALLRDGLVAKAKKAMDE